MKTCLIIPPSIFLLDERVFMNLGLLKVAAVLEDAGVPVEVIDLSGVENFEEAARTHFQSTPADTVCGMTSTTPQMPQVVRIAEAIRSVRPSMKIILGGPHATLVHTAFQKESNDNRPGRAAKAWKDLERLFDVLVVGDGEEAIFLALQKDSPKVIDANNRKSPLFLDNKRYNASPFPARHLVDVGSYHYSIDQRPAISLIAQLGCPFSCGFCGGRESPSLRVVRMRTTENILEEVDRIYRVFGYTGFMFYDDELNVSPKMVELMNGLTGLQKDLGVDFRLRGFVKAELFNDQQAEAMYKAGFRWLLTGFESGSPRILENINKRATREDNTRCVEIARRHGLKVKALMSIGHPGESAQTVRETRDWLLEVKPDDFDVTIITTYPGTPYYDQAVRHTDRDHIWIYTQPRTGDCLYGIEVDYNKISDYYKGDPNGGYKAYVYTDYLSPEDLVRLRDATEREVREKLNIPFNPGAPAIRFEHSMGQSGGPLPDFILRRSEARDPGQTQAGNSLESDSR